MKTAIPRLWRRLRAAVAGSTRDFAPLRPSLRASYVGYVAKKFAMCD
jgi:hypothetical protein